QSAAGPRAANGAAPGPGTATGLTTGPAATGGPTTGPSTGGGGTGGAGGGPTAGGPVPVPGGGTTTGLTKDTITLGIFYPRTGFYAGIFRNAATLFQAAAAEAGLINGRRLVLKFYDDGSANASTIQAEEKPAKDEAFTYMSIVSESNVVLAPLADQ